MLRLPPTRIIFDARDIEYHSLNGEERIKHLVSQGLKKRTAFGYPFAQLNQLRAALAQEANDRLSNPSEQDREPGISEQLLRDTVLPDSRREPWDDSLDHTINIKSHNAELLYVDGQVERFVDTFGQTNDLEISKHNSTPEELSAMTRATSCVTSDDIEKLTNKMQDLATEGRRFNSIITHEGGPSPTGNDSDHFPRLSMNEPRLPSPISQVSRMPLARQTLPIRPGSAHYSSPTQYLLHASPAESASHSSPRGIWRAQPSRSFTPTRYQYHPPQIVQQTMSSTSSTNTISRVYSVPDLTRHHHRTNPPTVHTALPVQGTSSPVSASYLPRTPRRQVRIHTVEDYSDVFDFGQSAGRQNRFLSSRNAYARQRNGIFIYEDDLPSELQPQTPIGLPRHGIPHNYGTYPLTAPPVQRPATTVLQPTTPTRADRRQPPTTSATRPDASRNRYTSDHDQENAAMYVEMERRRQSRADRHMAMRRGTDSLDTTPPMTFDGSVG